MTGVDGSTVELVTVPLGPYFVVVFLDIGLLTLVGTSTSGCHRGDISTLLTPTGKQGVTFSPVSLLMLFREEKRLKETRRKYVNQVRTLRQNGE